MSAEKNGNIDSASLEEGGPPAGRRVTMGALEFEKLYLQSAHATAGDLRKRFANPTPLGLVTFCIPVTTLAAFLLELHGTSAASITTLVGAFFFVGGMGQTIVGVLEFFLGNTFPFVVFTGFAGLFLSLGYLNAPMSDIAAAYGGAEAAAASTPYLAGLAMYLSMWTAMLFVFTVIAIRTNIAFVTLLLLITIAVAILAAAYFAMSSPTTAAKAPHLLKVCGGVMFASAIPGWYIVFVQLAAAVDFPFELPLGDLSTRIKGKKSE